MEHFSTAMDIEPRLRILPLAPRVVSSGHTILVMRDGNKDNDMLAAVCDFLDIHVEYAPAQGDLEPLLANVRPMAVIADLEGEAQDGFHVMKLVSDYNKRLPILLLTNNEPAILGAIDAMKEICCLGRVSTATEDGSIGDIVDFL